MIPLNNSRAQPRVHEAAAAPPVLAVLAIMWLAGYTSPPAGSPDAQALRRAARYPPAAYPITSTSGDLRDSASRRRRKPYAGVDIRAPAGTVVFQQSVVGGCRLLLEYSHLARVSVHDADEVRAGQVLGTVGSSGSAALGVSHLHFGVLERSAGMLDPATLLFGSSGIACAAPEGVAGSHGAPSLFYPVACTAR